MREPKRVLIITLLNNSFKANLILLALKILKTLKILIKKSIIKITPLREHMTDSK